MPRRACAATHSEISEGPPEGAIRTVSRTHTATYCWLEVHEAPALGRTGRAPLIAGDVVAIEPGTVDPEHGGMRVEDLVFVTDDGYELLTERSYDLVP